MFDLFYPEGSQNHTVHKDEHSTITLTIGTVVMVRKRSDREDYSLIRNAHVSLYPSQVRRLKEIARRGGKWVTQLVREAVEVFLNRQTYERNTFNFDPPRGKTLRRIYPVFPRSHWDALKAISRGTGKCGTELVREAVAQYLRESASA